MFLQKKQIILTLVVFIFILLNIKEINAQNNISSSEKNSPDSTYCSKGSTLDTIRQSNVDDSVSFATNWYDIASMPKDEQVKQIIIKAKEYFKKIRPKSSKWVKTYVLNRQQITKLTNSWMEIKRKNNEDWLNKFLKRESILNMSYQNLAKAIQDTTRIRFEIKARNREIYKYKYLKEAQEASKKQINNWISKNKENYKSRLSFLSLGVITIARVNKGYDAIDNTLRKMIRDKMIDESINRIKGERIETVTKEIDSSVKSDIIRISDGRAQVGDVYFKPVRVRMARGNYEYIYNYFIKYIEVYPFNIDTISHSALSKRKVIDNLDSIDVFFLENDSLLIPANSNNSDKSLDIDSIGFTKEPLEYLKYLNKIVKESKERIMREIKNYTYDYRKEYEKYENMFVQAQDSLEKIKTKLVNLEEKNRESKEKLKERREAIKRYKNEYKINKHDYENFYKNRIRYVNNIEQDFLNSNVIESLVHQSFDDIKREIKTSKITNRVMIEQSGGEARLITLKSEPITYSAKIDGFRILYLTKKEIGTNRPLIILNLAYKVRYTPNDYLKIDTVNSVIIDTEEERQWFVPDKKLMSVIIHKKPDEGWRIPTFKELEKFSQIVRRYTDDNNVHPFEKLSWPLDFPYLSDPDYKGDTKIDEDNVTIYRCFDFKYFKEELLYPEDGVYVIFVRQKK